MSFEKSGQGKIKYPKLAAYLPGLETLAAMTKIFLKQVPEPRLLTCLLESA